MKVMEEVCWSRYRESRGRLIFVHQQTTSQRTNPAKRMKQVEMISMMRMDERRGCRGVGFCVWEEILEVGGETGPLNLTCLVLY
ncbi:hypothetical protein VTL71DRAFT_10998 [Oculimacula yallundae]|uniref:Uncharacterized protein n=1 Tax=Oculimacula yallundae TaxID=86028 RepID=A0ABR4CV22_9HELO